MDESLSNNVMMDDDDDDSEVEIEGEREEVQTLVHDAKLRELLNKITSNEIKLCKDGTKEFIKFLKSDSGGELLRFYVQISPKFAEFLNVWKLWVGKNGMLYVMSLISAIFSHSEGKYKANDKERHFVSRTIDKFARLIVEEKMDGVYKELNSKDGKRQKAALLLMASIARRGSGLASEVAKTYDFKLQGFSKLAEYKQRQNEKRKKKKSTRKAFVGFAMSFLEVGKPGLLRWVLQQKEMYSGVLRGLGNDDDETVTYVLSTLRERVLTEQSLVPPGLRSVLFGNVTLEQLVGICGRENGGSAAELAHNVLVMVCTDPNNGLMPDLNRHPTPLRGNPKRILGLMKKLKATEIGYHRDLLLAIVKGRPLLASAYLEECPYSLEDYASPSWFSTVSLTATLVSSVGSGLTFGFLDSQSDDLPSFDSVDVQSIINCICPRPFSRPVINKGLLHSDFLVKNGTLRLLLEGLKLLDSFFRFVNLSGSMEQMMHRWASLKQEIQNEIQTLLPDAQVLLTLLSSLGSHTGIDKTFLKRKAEKENVPEHGSKRMRKLRRDIVDEDMDFIIAGISSAPDIGLPGENESIVDAQVPKETDSGEDLTNVMSELWGSNLQSVPVSTLKDAEIFFQSKLLDALKIYLLTMPTVLEGSFDFFMNLLSNSSGSPINLQFSLLSLLVEYIKWSPRSGIAISTPSVMYKHLQTFINLLIFSRTGDMKIQAYALAWAAMSSTGAFDRNLQEIIAWFLFIPGYTAVRSSIQVQGTEVLQSLSPVVISFLCDAISTIGNNLFKYWDALRNYSCCLKGFKDASVDFSPFIICILQKCVRLLSSKSGTFSLPEKSMISAYVSSTLKHVLQTQVDAGLLSALIRSVLSEGLPDNCSLINESEVFLCEWRPLKNLLLFAERISNEQTCSLFSFDQRAMPVDGTFKRTLDEVRNIVETGHGGETVGIAKALSSSIICTTSNELLKNFPSLIITCQHLRVPDSLLSSIISLEQSFLTGVLNLWPEVFSSGLEMVLSMFNSQGPMQDASAKAIMPNVDFDVSESVAAVAFALFLRQMPFDVLFPAIMSIDIPSSLEFSKIKDLLLAKLSELPSDCVVSHLRLLLFWLYQIRSSYRIKPLAELEQLAEICCILVKRVVARPFGLKLDSPTNGGVPVSADNFREVAETIFCHPAVIASLANPLSFNVDFIEGNFGNSLEAFLSFSGQMFHKIDHHVLDMLTATFDDLLLLSGGQHHSILDGYAGKQLVRAFNTLVQRLFQEVRDKLDQSIRTEDPLPLLSSFYFLHALIRFVSPFELLNLVHWIFDRVDVRDLNIQKPSRISAHSIGLFIAGDAFDVLSAYLQPPRTKEVPFYMYWKMEEKNFDVNIIELIYFQACKFATDFDEDSADACLLKAVNAVYRQKYMQHDILHPLSLVLSRIMTSTPIEIVSKCIYRTSSTKAKLLSLLVEMSPLHLSVFGHLFLGALDEDFNLERKSVEKNCDSALSSMKFVALLPAALSYLNSVFVKFEKQHYKRFTIIPSFYSRELLNGFSHWKSFVSGYVFQEDYNEVLPSSTEELLNLMDSSLLGKAIHMLQLHFSISGEMKMKERLKLFNSILTYSNTYAELLDCDVGEMEFFSHNQSLNLINRVVAKISFCWMLLFPKDNQILSLPKDALENLKEVSSEMVSKKEGQSRMRFLKILVDAWQFMVKKIPSLPKGSTNEKISDGSQFYRYLELFIFRNIFELTVEMRDDLIQLESLPFLDQLMRSSLLYRFENPTTLQVVRKILILLSDGKFSCALYLQLLLAHSQFASTIQSVTDSFGCQTGAFVKPMSSILRSLAITRPNSKNQTTELHLKQLEIVKLLKTLIQLKPHQSGYDSGQDLGINLKELHLLLLSSYGATLRESDLEMYNLMLEIESIDKSVFDDAAEMDYLWGTAALKVRKERALDQETSQVVNNAEAVKEHKKSQFRENLPLDPKICMATVLYFPYDRTVTHESLSLDRHRQDNLRDGYETRASGVEHTQRYDPVFILRFSIHALSMGYIEPVEFAGLGLLAVAFASMSSPDVGMRKLGYESIGRYKNVLENCWKTKDVMRLRLLLTYLQNGIAEPWQRIPSVISLFAAESSFILLDPSCDHYTTLSKHLMHSSKANMKSIPLFHAFFQSNSINFRMERLWMLRLIFGGLNLDDDAPMFIRNSIFETLLSFYSSPLSDNESKEIILQIVKKAAKLHKMARYLAEHCGLFPWLSSILSSYRGMRHENKRHFFSQQLVVIVEVVNDVVSSRNIVEWLQNHALEQLMEPATYLHKLLVGDLKFMKENVSLVDSILQIMLSTLKTSQKRKIYQPHFTLSFDCLFQIYQALDVSNTASPSASSEVGLKAMLMSSPPVDIFQKNQENLSSFLMWAVSTAMNADSSQMTRMFSSKESHLNPTNSLEETPSEESLMSKLLRWLVASVILGKLSCELNNVDAEHSRGSSSKSLGSFLEYVGKSYGESNGCRSNCEEVLAAAIFHLQQLLGMNCTVLPSVVSALCLLLLCDASKFQESGTDLVLGYRTSAASLWSQIRCPTEAKPAWRWSFYQPWKDLSSELTESQKMDELHACQTILVIITNVQGKKSLDTQVLSPQHVENSGIFRWERSIIEIE